MNSSKSSGYSTFGRTLAFAIVMFSGIDIASASEPVRITTDGVLKLSPTFLGNSDEIVYSVHEQANLVAIVRLRPSDGLHRREHPTVTSHQFDPAYSRDGYFHAYAMSANAPQMVLVIQDLRTKKESVFRPRESRATARNPSIAPDGSNVVFSLSDIGGHQIASVDMQGKALKSLTSSSGMNAWPTYSPDGRQIAFGSSRSGEFELYAMDSDGSNIRRLTRNPGIDARPAWSPDGSRIAFTSNRDGNYEIYIMNKDGSGVRNVTSHSSRDDYATWHPNGRQLLFVSDRDGGSDLYLIRIP